MPKTILFANCILLFSVLVLEFFFLLPLLRCIFFLLFFISFSLSLYSKQFSIVKRKTQTKQTNWMGKGSTHCECWKLPFNTTTIFTGIKFVTTEYTDVFNIAFVQPSFHHHHMKICNSGNILIRKHLHTLLHYLINGVKWLSHVYLGNFNTLYLQ